MLRIPNINAYLLFIFTENKFKGHLTKEENHGNKMIDRSEMICYGLILLIDCCDFRMMCGLSILNQICKLLLTSRAVAVLAFTFLLNYHFIRIVLNYHFIRIVLNQCLGEIEILFWCCLVGKIDLYLIPKVLPFLM